MKIINDIVSTTKKLYVQGMWDMCFKDDQSLYIFATGSGNVFHKNNAHHCQPVESKIDVPDVR